MHGLYRRSAWAVAMVTAGLLAASCAQGGGTAPEGMDAGTVDEDAGFTAPDVGFVPDAGPPLCGDSGICAATDSCCGGVCADTLNDPAHCGSCTHACNAGDLCVEGMCMGSSCMPACPMGERCIAGACMCGSSAHCSGMGQACCGSACVDTQTSSTHCGRCDNRCATGQACVAGMCQTTVCTPSCAMGETCVAGRCMCGSGAACGAGRSCCGGACISTSADVANCGGCGRACGAGQACCSGSCANTMSDVANCGGCGRACDAAVSDGCSGGACKCGSEAMCLISCQPIFGCVPL